MPKKKVPISPKVDVPIDPKSLEELQKCFEQLSVAQQDFLITRFPHCDTDKQAAEMLSGMTPAKVDHWKRDDQNFARAYNLLKGRLIDWARHLAQSIEAGNVLLAAAEARKLLLKPWDALNAREASAKGSIVHQTLDRALGGEGEQRRITRVEDLIA